MTPFDCLREFHEKFGAAINQVPTNSLLELRNNLIREESWEVEEELIENSLFGEYPDYDPKRLTKELADLLYVTIGAAVTFGLPLEEVFYEVHKSNMSKLGEDGKPIMRSDGKILKGPFYKEPDLDKFF